MLENNYSFFFPPEQISGKFCHKKKKNKIYFTMFVYRIKIQAISMEINNLTR